MPDGWGHSPSLREVLASQWEKVVWQQVSCMGLPTCHSQDNFSDASLSLQLPITFCYCQGSMISAGFSLFEAIPSYFILWYSLYLEVLKTGPREANSPPQMPLQFYTSLLFLGEADWGKNKSRDHTKLTLIPCKSETENPSGCCALFLFMRVRPSQLHHPIPLLKCRLEDKTVVEQWIIADIYWELIDYQALNQILYMLFFYSFH